MATTDPKYLEADSRKTFAEKHWRKNPHLNGNQVRQAVKDKFGMGISFATMRQIRAKIASEAPPTVESVLAEKQELTPARAARRKKARARRKTAQEAVNEMAADMEREKLQGRWEQARILVSPDEQQTLREHHVLRYNPEPVTEAGITLSIRERTLELQALIDNNKEVVEVQIRKGQKALITFTHTIEV